MLKHKKMSKFSMTAIFIVMKWNVQIL